MQTRKLTILLCVLSLFGCASGITAKDFLEHKKQKLINEGKSQEFIDGYINGCSSGKFAVGNKSYKEEKDQINYMNNIDYNIGWERGYYSCRDEEIERIQKKVVQEYIPASNVTEEKEREKIWEDVRK